MKLTEHNFCTNIPILVALYTHKMSKYLLFTVIVILCLSKGISQEKPITIEEERVANRLMLYAINENLVDLDLKIVVSGTNFRQSKSVPRFIRLPSTSRVHVANLMLTRGVQPSYTYELEVKDSLSRRALKKPFTKIRVSPKKNITVYITENCTSCDTIVNPLERSPYKYTAHNLAEKPEIKKQLSMALPSLDTITRPIISLNGSLFTELKSFEELLEKLNNEK